MLNRSTYFFRDTAEHSAYIKIRRKHLGSIPHVELEYNDFLNWKKGQEITDSDIVPATLEYIQFKLNS